MAVRLNRGSTARRLFVYICFARCGVSVQAKVWQTNKVNLSKTKILNSLQIERKKANM